MSKYEASVDLSDPETSIHNETPEAEVEHTPPGDALHSDLDSGYTEAMTESKETISAGHPERRQELRNESIPDTPRRDIHVNSVLSNRVGSGENKTEGEAKLSEGGVLLSTFYGIFVVNIGLALSVNEALRGKWLEEIVSAVFQVYLYSVSFVFLVLFEVYLTFSDRCRCKPVANDAEPGSSNHHKELPYVNMASDDGTKCVTGVGSSGCRQLTVLDLRLSNRSSVLSESTVFDDGDGPTLGAEIGQKVTETTLYIRIVFLVLGLAVMVYDGLLIKQLQQGFVSSTCDQTVTFWPQYVHVAFLLIQCYFLFKHSQIKTLRNKAILRMGFVHVMTTDINVMIRAFINQTYNEYVYGQVYSTSAGENSTDTSVCQYDVEDMTYRAAPYLYPCVIEYNFLAASLVYFMYSSLGDVTVYCAQHGGEWASRTEISCQRTHKGLFFGVVVLAGTTVSIILFFAYLNGAGGDRLSVIIYQISDLSLHAVLILAASVAWYQTRKLGGASPSTPTPTSTYPAFEDGVLLASMSCAVLFNVFFLQPVVAELLAGRGDSPLLVLSLTGSVIAIVAETLQASFVVVELSSSARRRRRRSAARPGRGGVAFLLFADLAVWLLKTFQVRALDLVTSGGHERAYGHAPWRLICNGLLPLLVYYYLLASAALARNWHQTYVDADDDGRRSDHVCDRRSRPAAEFESVRRRRAARLGVAGAVLWPVSDV